MQTPFEYLLYLSTMNYLLFEIFFILYFGNEITLNSGKLSTCLFQSEWFVQSVEIQQNVNILMGMLTQPIRLLVGFVVIFPLNLATFSSVSLIFETKILIIKILLSFLFRS